ncbi:MAG TPA: hypothetical protein DD412_07435 [Holosporales bacterium]|nr:hypothetical protein [Holosporales bacterium]
MTKEQKLDRPQILFRDECWDFKKSSVELVNTSLNGDSTKDINLLSQEINKSSNASSYTDGKLIFGLIDAVVIHDSQSDAEEDIACIQDELKNINVQNILHDKLFSLYKDIEWFKTKQLTHIKDINVEEFKELGCDFQTDATLVSLFIYKLSPDFKSLTGTIYVTIYPTSEKLLKIVNAVEATKKPMYKTNVSTTEVLENGTDDIKKNAELWAKNNGKYLKKSMKILVQKLVLSLGNLMIHPQPKLEK